MKKFEFSLEKLLDFKNQLLQKEKNDLANIRRLVAQTEESRARLLKKITEADEDLRQRSRGGISPQQLNLAKSYIKSLSDQIRDMDLRLEELRRASEKQLGIVVEMSKEVNTMDKLKEKQLEEYVKDRQKEEENFIEEYVSNSEFYKI